MKSATITRIPQDKANVGKWISYENGKVIFACDTIELPYFNNKPQISCIPKGVYDVVYRESKKYPRHYHILNVPNRDLILVHQANFVAVTTKDTQARFTWLYRCWKWLW